MAPELQNALASTEIWGIRHAFSLGQEKLENYIVFGDAGIGLAEEGIRQTRLLRDFISRNHPPEPITIICSDFSRAQQTMQWGVRPALIDKDVQVITRPYMGEHRHGEISGLTHQQMHSSHADFMRAREIAKREGRWHTLSYPGVDVEGVSGESQQQVFHRTRTILDDVQTAHEQGRKTVIVVAHGTSLRGAKAHISGVPESSDDYWQNAPLPRNTQIDRFRNGRWEVLFEGFPDPVLPYMHPAAAVHDPLLGVKR